MRILVTGGNKGIGLAIVNRLLRDEPSSTVYLGSRDISRGKEAVNAIISSYPAAAERLRAVEIDVTCKDSVLAAAFSIRDDESQPMLDGVINNAGIAHGDFQAILATNLYGVKTVTDAFFPILKPRSGRIVNISSASGPMFVAKCNEQGQRFFTNKEITWTELSTLIEQVTSASEEERSSICQTLGLPGPSDFMFAYGLSKACLNCLSMIGARENPTISVNGCSPGYIETDLTRPFAEAMNKTPADMGMKSTDHGAFAPCHLMLSDRSLLGTGWYYGSDAKRSPLDKYRSPGDPAYTD